MRIKKLNFLIIFLVFFNLGCAKLNFFNKFKNKPIRYSSLKNKNNIPANIGKIINSEKLKKGGKILIMPFRPGRNVALNESTDKIALLIVKSFSEIINNNQSNFEMVFDDGAETADFIIEGRIIKLEEKKRFKKFLFKKNLNQLNIEAKMYDDGNQLVAVFHSKKEASEFKNDALAYLIGQEMAKLIVSSGEKQ